MARQLGASEREVETAYALLLRYIADRGPGHAGEMTVDLVGLRRTGLSRRGIWVRGSDADATTGAALLADPLVLLAFSGPVPSLHWTLLPGGPSVTARADALRFLRALASGGMLTFRFKGNDPVTQVEAGRTRWKLTEEWRLFEDLATLEEWPGSTIPMPDVVTAADATLVGQAATWARTQTIDARISVPIAFRADRGGEASEPDSLRLLHDFRIPVLGVDVSMGQGSATVQVDHFDRLDDFLTHQAWPAMTEVGFHLSPPAGRRLRLIAHSRSGSIPPRAQPALARPLAMHAAPARHSGTSCPSMRRVHSLAVMR